MKDMISDIKNKKPLVHHITNYVTVNDCANVTLAIGGAPVMADAIEEVEDMVGIASALVINIGTLNSVKVKSMIMAGQKANELGIPVIFDPVGCGATAYRREVARLLMGKIHMTVIRGNLSEIMALAEENIHMKGVDAGSENISQVNDLLKNYAKQWKTILAVTGAVDKITDGQRLTEIKNGCKEMSTVTGTGCMCTSLVGTFVAAARQDAYDATVEAIMTMGIAGEISWKQNGNKGLGHFHMGIIDEIGEMNINTLKEWGRIHEI